MSIVYAQQFPKGTILVPVEGRYPDGALVTDGYDPQGNLLAHPQGGGPQFIISPAQAARLRPVPPEEVRRPIWRMARFAIEDVDATFEGWTSGRRWNGWEMPAFEFSAAQEVARVFDARYDVAQDCFTTQGTDGNEVWPAQEIVLVGEVRLKVYSIGAGCWIWDEV